MAKAQQTKVQNVICNICGKTITPTEAPIPTEYVWYDGIVICNECLRSGAMNKKKEEKK